MSRKAIVYGNVITDRARREIFGKSSGQKSVLWQDKPIVPAPDGSSRYIFIDLDDPRFSNTDFLMSLATSGEDKIVGKLARPDINKSIRVSKLGVSEILTPDQCLERLHIFLNDLEKKGIDEEKPRVDQSLNSLIGSSTAITEIRKTIKLLSEVDFPSALILGETGTGKGLISKILHNTGVRSKHNLVEVNCSAIPDELFESELYGHARGAFTDARSEKTGLFEYAQDGTLFLDEVGNLSASAQAKLLKILEDKKLRRVGDVGEKDINVRVVAATNLDLNKAIEASKFREDLYFRLNLLTIDIPPLRKRQEDIPAMVDHFLAHYTTLYNRSGLEISDDALEEMKKHSWPGNIRELSNVIERAVLLIKSHTVKLNDIRNALRKSRISPAERQRLEIELPSYGVSLEEIEQKVVKQVLDMFRWNKSEAAKYLDISRPRLRRIIESAGLDQNRRKK